MTYRLRKPELLAPAGNMECLHAAVCAGADAVYLGLDEFNARRNADNFTLETLAEACDYAHLRGVAIYVTMNVEVLPSELERALDYARHAYLAGADALIVQDAGLTAELHRTMPAIELHASTQMNIHNAAGIEAAALLGAQRVTLARELSLAEITELCTLAAGFGMQIECFAHGALCICYSGQCLMSSMIGGRSANRGLCAQACRLPYELHCEGHEGPLPAEGEHLLSPRDLCTIDLLDELVQAGVASLKIEGRMKSADYVHEVVSVYREALDELGTGQASTADAQDARKARLAEAFSRGFTTAYLENERGNAMMSYGRPNNRGVFAGRVAKAYADAAEVAPEIELHEGDVLEFWTNRGHFAATIPAGACAQVTQDRHGQAHVRVPVDQRVGKGDRVFRVRNALAAFTSFEDDPQLPRVGVSGQATLFVGQPAHMRFETERSIDGGQSFEGERTFGSEKILHDTCAFEGEAWGDEIEPARTKPLAEDDVKAHIDRLGQTPYRIAELSVDLGTNAGMGFSQLHRLRTEALDALTQDMLKPWHDRKDPLVDARDDCAMGRSGRTKPSCLVMAWATNPGCARAAKRAGANGLYVPLLNYKRGQAQTCGARGDTAEQAGYPKQCVMALPTIDHDPVEGTREERLAFEIWNYVHEGKPVFADSLAGAVLALDAGATVELGPHVPLVNKASLRFAADLGIRRVWLSPELTLGQIADLAEDAPVELGLFVSGAQELMICEHCLLMSQGACAENCETCPRRSERHWLVDRKGFEFPVVTDLLGRSHLYNGIELDAVSALPDLVDAGVSAVMVDTTLMDKKTAEAAVKRVVRAADLAVREHRALDKRPNTTTGHLFRGVL